MKLTNYQLDILVKEISNKVLEKKEALLKTKEAQQYIEKEFEELKKIREDNAFLKEGIGNIEEKIFKNNHKLFEIVNNRKPAYKNINVNYKDEEFINAIKNNYFNKIEKSLPSEHDIKSSIVLAQLNGEAENLIESVLNKLGI